MRDIVKAFRRPPAVRLRDRNGGFPWLSDGVPLGLRGLAPPRHARLAERLGKPSLWVINKDLWYYIADLLPGIGAGRGRPLIQAAAATPPASQSKQLWLGVK